MPNRIIKESIWSSPTLSQISLEAQAFWLRLLPLPDDHGCFDARSAILRGKLYPLCLTKVTEANIEAWLTELESVDSIRRWLTPDGITWGLMTNWSKHQRIRSLHQRKTPEPPENLIVKSLVITDVNCRQLTAIDRLNPNPNPNQNIKDSRPPAGLSESLKVKLRNEKLERVNEILNYTGYSLTPAQIFKLFNNGYNQDYEILSGAILMAKNLKPRELFPFLLSLNNSNQKSNLIAQARIIYSHYIKSQTPAQPLMAILAKYLPT